MRVFNSWAALRGEVRPIYLLSPIDLDKVLQNFYAEARKANGDEYEPNSLASMQAGIDRYLKENNYHVSIIRDKVFSASRAVLEGKCKNPLQTVVDPFIFNDDNKKHECVFKN